MNLPFATGWEVAEFFELVGFSDQVPIPQPLPQKGKKGGLSSSDF